MRPYFSFRLLIDHTFDQAEELVQSYYDAVDCRLSVRIGTNDTIARIESFEYAVIVVMKVVEVIDIKRSPVLDVIELDSSVRKFVDVLVSALLITVLSN